MVDEFEGPLDELVVGGVGGLRGDGGVVFHQFGQFLLDHLQDVAGQPHHQLVVLVVELGVGDHPVINF